MFLNTFIKLSIWWVIKHKTILYVVLDFSSALSSIQGYFMISADKCIFFKYSLRQTLPLG